MIQIPTYIKAKNVNNANTIIPKIIIQTYKHNYLQDKIYNNIINILSLNPECDYYLITDDIGRILIDQNFDKKILDAYDKLHLGAAKGDFLRYIAMYIYGGIYIDLDSSITTNLNQIIDYNMSHYIIWDYDSNLMNTPIITKPKNPLILNIIEEVVRRISNCEPNIFLATGPTLMTDVIYNYITNENIYNTRANTSINKRNYLWLENENYKNGKIIHTSKIPAIQFKFDGYTDDLLYTNNEKYMDFVNAPTPYLYKHIHIGQSTTPSKTIELNKIYHSDTKLYFLHTHKDTFSYVFNGNQLTITRTDENTGWGHNLVAYL